MIAQLGHRLKVEKSDQVLTSFAGLPLLTELAHTVGLVRGLNAIAGLWERRGTYQTSDYVLGLAMTLTAGIKLRVRSDSAGYRLDVGDDRL